MKESIKQAREFVKSQGGQIATTDISEEILNPEPQDDLSLQAVALEPTGSSISVEYDVDIDSDTSEFNYFEDGKQRTIHIGYIKATYGDHEVMLPVHYFVVGAVILQRQEKKLSLWDSQRIRQGILVQKSLVPNQTELEDFENSGLEIVDTEGEGGDYFALRSRALQKSKSLRLELEDDLIRHWRETINSDDDFLIVDGTLMNFRDERNVQQCVGVSKSFGSRYFTVTENHRIIQMDANQRSWTFRFHEEEESISMGARERVSWYLRLRTGTNESPEFGLIRVEISRQFMKDAPAYADRFSKSLISERLPTAYPDSRWDKHLYPIKVCENYLSSVMPSITTISESMKGVFQ